MREMRSGSQMLFGHLPEQTVDAAGGIWKVKRWNEPKTVNTIDTAALREELIRAAYPWKDADPSQDGGFVDDLLAHKPVRVHALNREEGVFCEPFPRLFMCQRCKRLYDDAIGRCRCGSTARRGQLPFVGYHEACGAIKTPYVRKCPQHQQRAVRFPGTASAAELIFYCPECPPGSFLNRGFGASCDCALGGVLSFTVHRSGNVFKPRGISMINPPRREILLRIEQAGGGERALEWMLEGMVGRRLTESAAAQNPASIRKLLEDRGFDDETITAMIAAMPATADPRSRTVPLDPELRADAERQAKQVALATFESRITITDLLHRSKAESLRDQYRSAYPRALRRAGFERIELIDRFPVLTAQFGYTRGKPNPGDSRLRTYRQNTGEYVIYGDLAQTEALLIRLEPTRILEWLIRQGFALPGCSGDREAAEAILSAMGPMDRPNPLTESVIELVHSISHAFIKRAAVFAGIERSALSEVVLPTALSFFVYAAARGDFVLGGLQALFESDLHHLLDGMVDDEHRCALDPGCEDTGSACAVCLHLGEPSCRMFNTRLSRKALAGGRGYFDITASPT
ncbi:hypothetical protein [Polymorphobacter megasporae]|uniref:hypothetical protein n=1 Tax=Glacieibacterium megasporae TaxID=2835787 RepID=UPI001C1E0BA7|nr:hypothetical protein [Polymorphobacter megasporae]UAJ11065.1 hypothetical protein KTC28_04965 [Polymorphobacter megasporae]